MQYSLFALLNSSGLVHIAVVMADNAGATTSHWAILIGINFYRGDRCLQGSVRDAETVKGYLEAGSTPVDIAILTATQSPSPLSCRPVEEPDFWPTRANVIGKLKRVLEKANHGDLVYIHYAGHGTRRKDSQESGHQSGNLAFVLFEDTDHGCSYLRGPELANCLRLMVAKGLLVTLVLDCCYSGSVLRAGNIHGADVRAISYKPAIDAASPLELFMDFSDSINGVRDAQMPLEQWLVNPNGYTILAACGPHERAWEIEIEGERRGALTYFLTEALSALRKSGVELTHQSLYQHLRTRFHASWPQQTPMRYGNKNFSFFGKLSVASNTGFASVYRTDDGRLCLSAGEAHGVHKGDEYAVYPFDTPEDVDSRASRASVMAKVDTVRCLTSDLMGVGELASPVDQIRTGWKAKPVTHFSPRKTSVRLMASGGCQVFREEAAKQWRFLRLCTENHATEPCIFNVTLNEHNEYEILDGSLERIVSLPTIRLDTPGASGRVMDVLQHLATFKYFEGVDNRTPSPSFAGSFCVLPTKPAGGSGVFNVKHGDEWSFTAENFGDCPLYLAIFNFTPSWKIVDLVSQSGEGDFRVIQPRDKEDRNKKEIRLQMEVPEFLQRRGKKQCEDVVKVFLTSKPTSFPSMVLPEISFQPETPNRAVRGSDGQLSKFLLELTAGFRGTDVAHEEWACRNFIICTTKE